MKLRLALGLAVAAVYALFSYGGIRSPDGEVLYRTAESLVRDGDFSIEPLEAWPEFGVARGRDGAWYGKYGPGHPLAAAPLVWLGLRVGSLDGARGLASLAPSHFLDDGYSAMRARRAPREPAGHVGRSVASLFNVIVGALCAMTMLGALERLELTRAGAIAGTLAFALGTPMLPYSGTFFSEPLVTLGLLAAVTGLLGRDTRAPRDFFAPGAALGLAVASHPSALLWVPFLAAHVAISQARASSPSLVRPAYALGAFLAGTAAAAVGLAAFDAARFGSVLETGRPAEDFLFGAPWVHALPLLLSWGKGLVVYCPLALVALASWPLLLRRRRLLGGLLLGGVLARLALFAAFHDWHGGFGPGPRYPLPEIAIFALVAALGLDRLVARGAGTAPRRGERARGVLHRRAGLGRRGRGLLLVPPLARDLRGPRCRRLRGRPALPLVRALAARAGVRSRGRLRPGTRPRARSGPRHVRGAGGCGALRWDRARDPARANLGHREHPDARERRVVGFRALGRVGGQAYGNRRGFAAATPVAGWNREVVP